MTFFKLLHLFAVLIWVGGMFFAYAVLRPATAEALQQAGRLRMWDAVLRRFFNWVWAAIGVILVTGFYLIYQCGGIYRVAGHVHGMLALGLLMMAIFVYAFFGCHVPFGLHVAKKRWEEAEKQLDKLRKLVALNLVLGVLTLLVVEIGMTV